MTETYYSPKSLQYMAIKKCCTNNNAYTRITKFEFLTGIISNSAGNLAIQLPNRKSLRLNTLQYVEETCNK